MITFSQDLPALYPAYNDSYIKFSSSLAADRAEIVPTDSVNFPNPYLIYPDADGNFLFNLKELALASFANQEFSRNGFEPFTWGQSFTDNKVSVGITINAYQGVTVDSQAKTYTFYKSIVQIGRELISDYLLADSDNGIDYRLKYWEGYPFDFQIKDLPASVNIKAKNLNSGFTSANMLTQQSGSFAVHIDKSGSNWTDSAFLPLLNFLNRLEIYQDDVFKANLELSRVEPCEGIYLRWYNSKGGYYYWLFDTQNKEDLQVRSMGQVAKNTFLNAGSADAPFLEYGKRGSKSMQLKTIVEKEFKPLFEDLYLSPNIELYSSSEPYVSGRWIAVTLEGSYQTSAKRNNSETSITIQLPDLVTFKR